MNRADNGVLDGIAKSLGSSDHATIQSTCEFLQTVVIYDFPAFVFLSRRPIIERLSCLCFHGNPNIAELAITSLIAICKQLVISYERRDSLLWKQSFEPVGAVVSTRDPGDGQEEDDYYSITLDNYISLIFELCYRLLHKDHAPPCYVLGMIKAATELAVRSGTTTSNITTAYAQLLSCSRQNAELRNFYISLVLLAQEFLRLATNPSPEFTAEIFNALIDMPMIHFHSDIYPALKDHLQEYSELYNDLHNGSMEIFKAFESAAKLQLNSDANLQLILYLLDFGEDYESTFIPLLLKNIHKEPKRISTLLNHPRDSVKLRTYNQICESITPLKKPSHKLLNVLLNGNVFHLIIKNGLSNSEKSVFTEAERLVTLMLKSRTWFQQDQWSQFISKMLPPSLPTIQQHWDKYSLLTSNIWDLLNQSIVPARNSDKLTLLDQLTVFKFLIRGLRSDSETMGKCQELLTTMLCFQREAHRLVPRLSSLQHEMLSDIFTGDQLTNVKSSISAQFEVETLQNLISTLSAKTLDLYQARSSLIQLGIVLEDKSLHTSFLEKQGIKILGTYLEKALSIDAGDGGIAVLPSVISCLLHISVGNNDVQLEVEILLNILR